MALDVTGIFDAAQSHALTTGLFSSVNRHEPKSAPASGSLTAALWVQHVGPVPEDSGLAATTGRVELRLRIYSPMLQEPQDAIDPAVIAAVDVLMAAYSGDFDLGGLVRNVDLLAATGAPLAAQAGYLEQDGRMYRVMDITLPLVVNNIWSQSP